jgi:hypothetical protein
LIRETVYTSIGAAALAVEFATKPSKQQNWLKKAERRGSKLTRSSERQIRQLPKQVESAIEDVTKSSLQALGLADTPPPKPVKAAKPRRKVRRRRAARRPARTTLTVSSSTPVYQAS